MSAFRYRSAELPYGVTREAIAWLGPRKQRGLIVEWVRENFVVREPNHLLFDEDDSFNSFEQVWDEFDGVVPSDVIDEAISELSHMGEWVKRTTPRKEHIEYFDLDRLSELLRETQHSGSFRIGSAAELQERAKLEGALARLTRAIAEIEGIVGKMGDNGGPADVSTPGGAFAHVRTHVGKIAKQVAARAPNPVAVAQSAVAIQGVAEQNNWLDTQMNAGAEAYIRAFCETSGKDHARLVHAAILAFIFLIYELLSACIGWLEVAVTSG
jgi:hypothetical protein